jgi:16S rRNA C1402 (ribose-2'-O) methylase RsmI
MDDFMVQAREVFGDRRFCIAREISKKNEKVIRGHLRDYERISAKEMIRGEIVVILKGCTGQSDNKNTPELHSRRDIMDYFHRMYGIPRKQVREIIQKKR